MLESTTCLCRDASPASMAQIKPPRSAARSQKRMFTEDMQQPPPSANVTVSFDVYPVMLKIPLTQH